MQIRVNLQIFLFIFIFVLTHQIEMYAWVMLFAFIHELGHMLAGIILKLKPKSLSLMPFGISITFEAYGYKNLIEIKKILLAFAGPFINFVIIIIALTLHIQENIKEMIIYSNLLIAIFNLIPLYPLDGGRILKGIIKIKKTEMEADKIINNISNYITITLTVISSIAILYFKNLAILFILAYLWIIRIKENKKYNMKKRVYYILENTDKCIDI